MTTTDHQPVGERAYIMRGETGDTWLEIANRMAYRRGEPDALRQAALVRLAKAWAVRRGEAWPVGSAVKAVKPRGVAGRLADLEQRMTNIERDVAAIREHLGLR